MIRVLNHKVNSVEVHFIWDKLKDHIGIQGVSQKTCGKESPVNSIIMVADVSRLRHFEAYIVKFLLCYRNFIQTILLRPGGNFNFRTKFSSDASEQLFDFWDFAETLLFQVFHVHDASGTSFIIFLLIEPQNI